ncbi:MAG: prolyl oligopeptidase family serine peptidase [Gammaproteobacteria bacterium]|nr:prolyl oligopeptidase family serine peptidase [Gammaproteobacteria bacterium]
MTTKDQSLASPVYPPAPRGEVVDRYHGVDIADPYRWLEDPAAPATREFVRAQNALAQPWLESLPQRAWIRQRLGELWDYERVGVPRQKGGRYFFLRNDGKQNQSVLHVADSLQATPRVLFDPNAASRDATVALARYEPSPDGSLVAYSLSDGGTDWEIWKFRRVADGVDLADELRFSKFWELSWAADGSGVYYSRYPARAGDPARGDDQAQPVVYFHRLGEPQERDRVIYAVKDHPTRAPSASVADDGRWLFVSLFDGYRTNGVDLIDLRNPQVPARPLFAAWDARYTLIGSEGDTLYVVTTKDAPRGRIIAVDARDPAPARWRELVAEDSLALDEASFVGGRIIARYVRDAHGIARMFDRDGRPLGEVAVPGLGTLAGFGGTSTDTETFFAYADYLSPGQVMRLDLRDGRSSVWRAPKFGADTSAYVTRQVFYPSRDGTRVPMYITHRRDLVKNGDAPTLLYGYGGFNISLTPAFRPAVITWLEMGGVYVEANLRGGGEYGEPWHEAGTRTRKQNVFDDFIAAAEFLVREGYTRPQRLAISGRSNGGLLVGATLLQRPELFAAALPAVGVLDMLRYHTASANARQWSSDYGLAEDPQEFAALRAYSPVHNVKPGVCYPATLVTTADRDDRVVPWHSYKFAAALQQAQSCAAPVLLRVETRAGHGAGKPTWMQIEDFADQWAFVAATLGMRTP